MPTPIAEDYAGIAAAMRQLEREKSQAQLADLQEAIREGVAAQMRGALLGVTLPEGSLDP